MHIFVPEDKGAICGRDTCATLVSAGTKLAKYEKVRLGDIQDVKLRRKVERCGQKIYYRALSSPLPQMAAAKQWKRDKFLNRDL